MAPTRQRRFLAATTGLALAASTLLVSASPAHAAMVSVSAGESIQAAIDVAVDGTVVEVGPGVYAENIDFSGKNVVVRAVAGPSVTTIDGAGAGTVVTFTQGETRAAVLEGFTIVNGSDTSRAGGVYISHASPTVRNNIVTENEGCSGSGMNVRFSSALIESNQIVSNHSKPGWSGCRGGGIAVGGAGAVEVIANTIADNSADSGAGGLQVNAAGAPIIARNVITGNSARYGGGVEMFNFSEAVFEQNLIAGNSATVRGGGVDWLITNGQQVQFFNNTVADNTAPEGSAMRIDGWQGGVVLAGNILSGPGSVLACGYTYDNGDPTFADNLLWTTSGSTTVEGGCTDPVGADGNESADPAFEPGSSVPSESSPAIDTAGSVTVLGPIDLAGNPRAVDGNGDGIAAADRGAYERQSGPAVTAPSEPTDLTVVRSRKARATVSWDPPVDDGGSPVTGYVVTVAETGSTLTTSGTAVTLQNIAKNESYTISVAAVNDAGAGPVATTVLEADGGGGPKCHPKKGC